MAEQSPRDHLLTFGLILLLAAGFYTLGLMVGRNFARRSTTSTENTSSPRKPLEDVRKDLDFYKEVDQSGPQTATGPASSPVLPLPAPASEIRFTVQVAALLRRPDVEEVRDALAKKGYPVEVLEPVGSDSYLRVLVGRYANKDEAVSMEARLREDGFSGFIRSLP